MITPTRIFIIPYRNRESQMNVYKNHMSWIMENEPNDYEFIFSHQNDNRPFNRGAMKNLGFHYVKQTYPDTYKNITLIFQDIDTMPGKQNLLHFNTTHGTVKHYYGFNFALGGVFSIKAGDFEKTNGFPNIWTWGFEDTLLERRCTKHNVNINRSNWYKIGDLNMLQFEVSNRRIVSKYARKEFFAIKDTNGITDIKQIKFNTSKTNKDKFTMVHFTQWNISIKYKSLEYVNRKTNTLINLGKAPRISIMKRIQMAEAQKKRGKTKK